MKKNYVTNLLFVISLMSTFLLFSCSGVKKESESNDMFTVKIINNSIDKVLLRYSPDNDLNYTFKFVDKDMETKFLMNGNLSIQYSLIDYDDAKILKIKQDTLINIKQNDIIIDDLPQSEKIKVDKKVLEKSK